MPASITMALVAVRPKVAGRSRLMPAIGPTRYREAQAEVLERLRHLDAERTAGQGHAQQGIEEIEGAHGQREGKGDGGEDAPPLHEPDQKEERREHGEAIAESLEGEADEGAHGQDDESLARLAPAHGGDGRGV